MQRRPANTLQTRAEFAARERVAWKQLRGLWTALPEAALLRPGASGTQWSVKDVMNHVAAWQEAAARVIPELQAGRWGSLGPSGEKFNQLSYAADQVRPLAESRRRLTTARRALLKLLATVTDEQLLDEYGRQKIGWWAKWSTYGHYAQHIEDLRRYRERLGLKAA